MQMPVSRQFFCKQTDYCIPCLIFRLVLVEMMTFNGFAVGHRHMQSFKLGSDSTLQCYPKDHRMPP